jgi:hypothetical protein
VYPNWILWVIQFFLLGGAGGQCAGGSMFVSLPVPLVLIEFIVLSGKHHCNLRWTRLVPHDKNVFLCKFFIEHFVWMDSKVCFLSLDLYGFCNWKFNILNSQKWLENHTIWNYISNTKYFEPIFTFWTNFNLKHNWFHLN